jgi:hypothetical protein
MGQPTLSSGTIYEMIPADDNLLATYNFYLKITASGDYSYYQWFGPYTLDVGCSSDPTVTLLSDSGPNLI